MASPTLQFKRGAFVNLPGLRAGEPGFTTDRYDLYVGLTSATETNQFFGSARYWKREDGDAAAEFKFVDADGINGISLRSPVDVGAGVTYTLPELGDEGHFLKLGEDGALEWASVSAGASFSGATLTDTTFSGISTFNGLIDATEGLDVSGHTELEDLNVSGIGTIATVDINGGDIDGTVIGASSPAEATFTELAYSNSTTSGISTVGELYVGVSSVLSVDGGALTLSNIDAIDETTRLTLESALSLDPNDFSSLNISGIATFSGFIDAKAGLGVTGGSTFDDVNVTGVATFSQAIDADLLGNAGTATSLATGRTFEISGDVVATAVTFDGTGNVNLVATIQPDSVALGSDTTGDYVATVTGTANQVSVSGSGGETAAVVLSLPDDVVVGTSLSVPTVKTATIQHSNGTEAITIDSSGNVGVSTNLTVSGDLNILGSTTTINTETLLVKDSLIEVGLVDSSGTLVPPTGDANIDVGMLFHYFDSTAKKAAVYWDDSAGRIKVASVVTEEDSILTAVTNGALEIGGLYVAGCEGSPVEVIGCVNGEVTITNAVIDGGSF
jgi:hypothetical protein